MRLYLIRHGVTDYNTASKFQGWAKIPLNADGVRQAASLSKRMAEFPLDVIYSSDLLRTVMTATAIAEKTKVPMILNPLLRERNPGDLTDQPYESGLAFFEDPDFEPPNGESDRRFRSRVDKAVNALLDLEGDSDRHVAVVTHGMFCSAFVRDHLNIDPFESPEFHWPNTGLSICDYSKGVWKLNVLADAGHLSDSIKTTHTTGA